jgi:predicted dehydrogenase
MESPIRVGIVGSRFAAEFHYTAYQRVTGIDVKVMGVTSLTKEHREDFARKRGIKAFNSLEEMLPEIDVIDVCTPGYAHEEVSITSLEAGKHIVVEKPFTGYFGPSGDKDFKGNIFPKEKMLEEAIASARRIIAT